MYSTLTVVLHPLTVAKIRRQILSHGPSSSKSYPATSSTAAPPSTAQHHNIATAPSSYVSNYIKQYYRGLGVVVSFAIPARIIYITTLEYTREWVDTSARHWLSNPPLAMLSYNAEMSRLILPLVTPLSGGIAGGLAAASSQLIIVPMDVVSQRLIVMDDCAYNSERGSAASVARSILQTDGWRGLYKGFGLSLFTSLPAGTIWWGTYAGVRGKLSSAFPAVADHPPAERDGAMSTIGYSNVPPMIRQGMIQIISSFSAAAAAAIATQPLDTMKTRLQVGVGGGGGGGGGSSAVNTNTTRKRGFVSIAKDLASTTPGLYKGLLPRIVHMGVWGSVLSAAFELLKLISRKDFEF